MQPLSSTSQRRSVAPKFAAELRRAMRERGGSTKRLCEATRIPRSSLGYYLAGRNLPTIEVAQRLTDTLEWPRLLQLVLEARTVRCARTGCPRQFTFEGGKPKLYCSEDCAQLAQKMRAGAEGHDTGGKRLYEVVRAELDDAKRAGRAVRKGALEVGLAVYARSDSKRHEKFTRAQRRIDGYAEAVDAMCRSCEPEGLCRDDVCPLRAFSPLPLAGSYTANRPSGLMREAEGSWHPKHRAKTLEAIRDAAQERWNRPGERERMSEITRARWAGMSPEERTAAGQAISEARRAS